MRSLLAKSFEETFRSSRFPNFYVDFFVAPWATPRIGCLLCVPVQPRVNLAVNEVDAQKGPAWGSVHWHFLDSSPVFYPVFQEK